MVALADLRYYDLQECRHENRRCQEYMRRLEDFQRWRDLPKWDDERRDAPRAFYQRLNTVRQIRSRWSWVRRAAHSMFRIYPRNFPARKEGCLALKNKQFIYLFDYTNFFLKWGHVFSFPRWSTTQGRAKVVVTIQGKTK